MALSFHLASCFGNLTGLRPDRLLMSLRLCSAWLLPLLTTVLSPECRDRFHPGLLWFSSKRPFLETAANPALRFLQSDVVIESQRAFCDLFTKDDRNPESQLDPDTSSYWSRHVSNLTPPPALQLAISTHQSLDPP